MGKDIAGKAQIKVYPFDQIGKVKQFWKGNNMDNKNTEENNNNNKKQNTIIYAILAFLFLYWIYCN